MILSRQSDLNGGSEDLEKLTCELVELIEIRGSARRRCVKEVLSSNIKLLENKIKSLKDDVSNRESIET